MNRETSIHRRLRLVNIFPTNQEVVVEMDWSRVLTPGLPVVFILKGLGLEAPEALDLDGLDVSVGGLSSESGTPGCFLDEGLKRPR